MFIIISSTIEYGIKTGIITGSVSAAVVLAIDIIFGGFNALNQYFQNDIALSAMFMIIAWTLGFYVKVENTHKEKLTEYANHDGLTGLFNHRYFHQYLKALYDKCVEEKRDLSLLLLDIDYFKIINDTYGHQKGDELLKELSAYIKGYLRTNDLMCRYGGDEFCVILPDTDKEKAGEIAQRIKSAVSRFQSDGEEFAPNSKVTISIGVSTLDRESAAYTALIENADMALYRAKFLRRNRVEVYASIFDHLSRLDDNKIKEESLTSVKTLLVVINSRDTYTYKHTERVVDYCRIMAEFLGLGKEDRNCLIYSAYLHDLGKINVPKELLISEQKLTDEEWVEIKRHPIDSANIIKQIEGFEQTIPIVLQHHEKFDGSGYPLGLSGERIPYLARILAIVDSFDAMTNNRPYQKVKTFEEAFEEIERCRGSHFDPILADQFIEMIKTQ